MTKIEWTEATWNPITGCTKLSDGCRNCYAERMAKRLAGRGGYPQEKPFSVTVHPDKLDQPLRWRKPRRVFVCSMGDLFHKHVPPIALEAIWNTMYRANWHTYQILTKRPERAAAFIGGSSGTGLYNLPELYPHVWLGTSVENQVAADTRIPELLKIPAAVRFLSVEPLLELVDLENVSRRLSASSVVRGSVLGNTDGRLFSPRGASGFGINWVIVGCESGSKRRPCRLELVKAIVDQCVSAGVPVFVKQLDLGSRVSHDPAEWPKWARRREYPDV